jgi:hypothetical protein
MFVCPEPVLASGRVEQTASRFESIEASFFHHYHHHHHHHHHHHYDEDRIEKTHREIFELERIGQEIEDLGCAVTPNKQERTETHTFKLNSSRFQKRIFSLIRFMPSFSF